MNRIDWNIPNTPNTNNNLTRNSTGISGAVDTIVKTPSERLAHIKELSHKLIYTWANKKEQIIIPANVLEELHKKSGINIHDYIQDPKFKTLLIETLNLESNYWFVRYDYSSAIILVKINDNSEKSENNETIWLTEKNIDFILSNILKIGDAKSRMNIVYNIINKINLEDLPTKYLSSFFDYWNYMQFVIEITKRQLLILSNKNIDLDVCNLISWFIVKEFSESYLIDKNIFFAQLRTKVSVPRDVHQPIQIHIKELGIDSHNIAISNIINPKFKDLLKDFLPAGKNYWLIYDKSESSILIFNKGKELRFNWLKESNLKEIVIKHLKLEHKENIRLFLSDIISSIDLNKLSQNKLASIFESGKYLDFVFDIIAKEVFTLAKWTIDKEISKWVTWYLFREHFDFINSRIWYLLSKKLISSIWIKSNSIYKVDEQLEKKVIKDVTHLRELFNQSMKSVVNYIDVSSFRKAFPNDIFLDFSNTIRTYFKNIGINNPDKAILKWIFISLIDDWEIKNPMSNFTEIIFEKIWENNDKLSALFWFFDADAIQISWEDKFPSFSFRDIEISSSEYSVERVFAELNKKLINYSIISSKNEQMALKNELDRIKEDFANTLFYWFIR